MVVRIVILEHYVVVVDLVALDDLLVVDFEDSEGVVPDDQEEARDVPEEVVIAVRAEVGSENPEVVDYLGKDQDLVVVDQNFD